MAKWIEKDERFTHYLSEGWNGLEGAASAGLFCACCGRALTVSAPTSDPSCATLDHIVPRAVSGLKFDRRRHNLVAACVGCNSSRAEQDMASWLAGRFDAAGVTAAWARIGERITRKLDPQHWGAVRAHGCRLAPRKISK